MRLGKMPSSKSKWQGKISDNFREIQNAESITWNFLVVHGSNFALFRII